MISKFISDYFFYVFLAFILFTFFMRSKRGVSVTKRKGMLFMSASVFLFYIYALALTTYTISDLYLVLYFAVIIPVFIVFRKHLFPFTKIKCEKCGRLLSFDQIIYYDSAVCKICDPPESEKDKK
jgi:fumarate reductase subunit D